MFMNHSFIHSFIHSFKTLLSLSNDGSTTIYNRICKQKGNGKSFHHATQNSILNTFPNNATSFLNIPFWKKIPHQMKEAMYTHAILWFPPLSLAVKHHNIKNWVPSILTHNLRLVFMGMMQIFFFFLIIPMKISHKLCVRVDGTQFLILWCFTAENEGGNDKIAWV